MLLVSDGLFLRIPETADRPVVSEANSPKKRKPGTAQDASNLEADELLRQQTKTTPAATICRPYARN